MSSRPKVPDILITHVPRLSWRTQQYQVQWLHGLYPNTVVRDGQGRRWVKQGRPYAVPFLADWRCTETRPGHLWATAEQLVDVLAFPRHPASR